IEAYFFPFEWDPTGPAFIDSINRAPGLLGTTRLKKSAGDFGRNSWHGPGLFTLLRDERVNRALGVSNFLQRHADGALAPVAGDFVGIEGAAGAPADDFTIPVFPRRLRQLENPLFQ